jgi:hypothetical protein
MTPGTLFVCLLERRLYAANGSSRKRKVLLLMRHPDSKQGWLLKVSVKYWALIIMMFTLQL